MDLATALDFAREHSKGVLATTRRDTRPQLSNVLHYVGADGTVRISVTTDRAKYHNIARAGWAALHVSRPDFWAWAVLEGPAEVTARAADPADAVVDELVDYYRALNGEHEDWAAYRSAMVAEHRAVARLRPEHAYGMLPE